MPDKQPCSSKHVDIAIVGGGAAGIGAARRLAGGGLSTILLEAGSRLGGRAWTHGIAGLDLDLGCGWFHSAERNAWLAIAEAAGIVIDRRKAQWGIQFRDLGFPKHEQARAKQAVDEWSRCLKSRPPASDCAADALVPDGEWNAYIRTIAGFVSGASIEKLSAADYATYDTASTDSNYRAPSGYGAHIARSFPPQVALHLATPVNSLALEPDGVAVITPGGAIRARAVILTISSAVLASGSLELPADLDPWRAAASALPLGADEKLFLEITGDAPFEDETQVLGNPRDANTGSYYIRPMGMPVIECFFGGEGACRVSQRGLAYGFEFALEQLCALFGTSIRGSLRPLVASSWSRMQRIGGSYSYALPGHADARAALARPFDDRVFFAGEATSATDFSTAHGAHDSGVRAADEASAALSKRS